MKVNIEAQWACVKRKNLRGIPYYIINVVKSLAARERNDYSISFFDFDKERDNRSYIDEYFGMEALRKLSVFECNSLNYKTIIDACASGVHTAYDTIPYSSYIGADADVFHFPSHQALPLNVPGRMVVTVHDTLLFLPKHADLYGRESRMAFENIMRYITHRKDVILIAVSQSTKNDIQFYTDISPKRIIIVPEAYDRATHFPERNDEMLSAMGIDAPFLLYLGGLDFRKGIIDILDSFEMLKPKYRELKLVLAGYLSPTVTPIIDRLSNYRFIKDVIMPGFVSDDQKRALLSSALVFLFPSEYEGFGLPVLEAMACGSPVITSNVSSLPEVGGSAALYVTPNAPEQLTAEIERLLNSEGLRRECIEKGFEHVCGFSWDKTAELTEEVYEFACLI